MAEIKVESEITGKVWKIEVGIGDRLEADDAVMILEDRKSVV